MINSSSISDKDVLAVDYFYDFLQFLNYLKENTVRRTVTGNITLKDIDALSQQFRNGKKLKFTNEKMGWKVRSEDDCLYLNRMRITAEVMYLLYKRRDQFLISKNGRAFLENLSPVEQHQQMILWFWNRVSWEYFNSRDITAVLQNNQRAIWRYLLEKGKEWIEFDHFCKTIERSFKIEFKRTDYYSVYPDFLSSDISSGLIMNNLKLFGLVETQMEAGKYEWASSLVRFRSTDLGLSLYQAGSKPF